SPRGTIAIGMPPSVGAVLTVPLVQCFRCEFPQMPSTLSLVERGMGYTLLSYGPARHLVESGRMKSWSVEAPALTRQLILATSSQRPTTAATRALAQMVRQQIKDLGARGLWAKAAGLGVP